MFITTFDAVEGLCTLLKRFSYPCRYTDTIRIFGRPVPQLSILTNTDYLYDRWNYLFNTMNQPWLSPDSLESFATAIYRKGAPMSNCWGFIDGTVRPVSRPGLNQRI